MSDDEGGLVVGPQPPAPVKRVRADALERASRAWGARVAGATWKEAAEVAGFASASTAQDAVRNAFGGPPVIDREALRHLWRERMERAWRQSVADMAERVPGAVTASVRVATLAVQLDGLAQPVQVDVSIDTFFNNFGKELQDAGF
jgi:AraC-like DNA-binding protein